jgi:hypothetical protein
MIGLDQSVWVDECAGLPVQSDETRSIARLLFLSLCLL